MCVCTRSMGLGSRIEGKYKYDKKLVMTPMLHHHKLGVNIFIKLRMLRSETHEKK